MCFAPPAPPDLLEPIQVVGGEMTALEKAQTAPLPSRCPPAVLGPGQPSPPTANLQKRKDGGEKKQNKNLSAFSELIQPFRTRMIGWTIKRDQLKPKKKQKNKNQPSKDA